MKIFLSFHSPEWNNFQSKDIPSYFKYGHIHHYALESIESLVTDYDEDGDCDLGHLTDKPLKNARKYVDSGFIHDVMDTKSKDYFFVRAYVAFNENGAPAQRDSCFYQT